MPKKRGNGEGSYRERLINGIKYIEGRIMINGRRYSRYAKTKTECRKKIDLLRLQGGESQKIDNYTIGEWLDKWLEEEVKRQQREKTYLDYKTIIKNHLKPNLGSLFLSEISRKDVQAFVDGQKKEGYNPSTIRIHYNILSASLKTAARDEIIEKNPSAFVVLPKKEKSDRKWFSIEEMKKFLAIDTKNDTIGNSLKFSSLTGLRRGELLALKWSDIDFEKSSLKVSRSLTRTENGYKPSNTKTSGSVRQIPLNQIALQILKDQKKISGDYALIFCEANGKIITPERLLLKLKNMVRKNDLPKIRVHDLRHSFASILHESNTDHKTIQSLLGHSNIQTTLNVYVHADDENKKRATEKLGKLL